MLERYDLGKKATPHPTLRRTAEFPAAFTQARPSRRTAPGLVARSARPFRADATRELAPGTAAWLDGLAQRLDEVAATAGVDRVAETLMGEVLGEEAWASFPEDLRQLFTHNGPAMLAEVGGEWWLQADEAALAELDLPVLLVAAEDSRPELREPTEALSEALPGARTATVRGGHLIDPAAPEVLAFIEEVVTGH